MFESRKRKFVEADQMYKPERIDSYFFVVTNDLYEEKHNRNVSRKKAYVAIHPNMFFSEKRLWRIYAMGQTKRRGPNYEKEWVPLGLVQTAEALTQWVARDWGGIHEDLLRACRVHVKHTVEQSWLANYPLDKFFEVVLHKEKLYLAFSPTKTDHRFYKIHEEPQPASSDEEDYCERWENWSDEWTILFPLYSPSDICFTSESLEEYVIRPKRNIRADRIKVCRDAVKQLMNHHWNQQHPQDKVFMVCMAKKSLYTELTEHYGKALPIQSTVRKIDILNRRKITRELLYRAFHPEPIPPKDIPIHKLKATFRTVAAFKPCRAFHKWKVYRLGGNILSTTFHTVQNLRDYTIIDKWNVESPKLETVRLFIRQESHFESLITDKELGATTASVVAKSPGD